MLSECLRVMRVLGHTKILLRPASDTLITLVIVRVDSLGKLGFCLHSLDLRYILTLLDELTSLVNLGSRKLLRLLRFLRLIGSVGCLYRFHVNRATVFVLVKGWD